MDTTWRRQKPDFHHQEPQRSHPRKPPQASWQPTVPSWEKKFCASIGSVPWRKLLETKRFMYLYDNVVHWNDSAGEEAFYNAKNRFWAQINGLPCNISLPDPDIYIDEIDWNSNIDPELLLDLEREFKVPEEVNKDEKVVILNSALLFNQSFSCTGWGDAEENFQKDTDLFLPAGNEENPWENKCAPCNGAKKDDGWGNYWNESWGWNQQDNNCNEWNNSYNEPINVNDGRNGGDWGATYSRKREGAGWYMSRYKTSRFHGDDYHMDRGWRNKREWKRSNISCERPFMDEKHSSRQWNSMNSCGPVSQAARFGKAGLSWGWEKQVW
ncbi:hypothetical protein Pint_17777 [Pistacia integerrima]|uniref:Uncharacterized protein n=1 Tax=Pistacia integerrima TaxID=434235 RepID=A0ACC0Z2L1_9ROSI|nr:hypothetical protein Pint_17777 [Pistacia integerrima]